MTRTLLQLAETAAVFAACLVVAAVTKPPTREEREARDFAWWEFSLPRPDAPLVLPGRTIAEGMDELAARLLKAGGRDE